ncbi:terpenoid cyclases/protein prenyltransferase alpha-alpha toroid [Aspergillus stella-maris]|uniref:terpenoid cyclases/protein prenyltransferase alpha-alpha toroid n=1 Tax=Aspergillus stella-maris TaxID=1810926 RepID=UPI003CCE1641
MVFKELPSQADLTVKRATDWAISKVHDDGHWCGELKSNVTITAEYIFLRQALGLDIQFDGPAYTRHLLSSQSSDGSWGLAPAYPGDVSTTTEAYLALKMLGTSRDMPEMQRARQFIVESGGVAQVRVFTRIFLAMFGLFPWSSIPELPVELVLLPSISLININKFASWARGTIAPLLIICHHRPVYALPNGRSDRNDYLDELWVDASVKDVPYRSALWDMAWKGEITELAFSCVDKLLYYANGLRSLPLLRPYARRRCLAWILERQEPTGDWAGIFPPMHASIFAFVLEGYKVDDEPVRLGIQALEDFAWKDTDGGKRIQACVSPVWDTALMSIGLCDINVKVVPHQNQHREVIDRAIKWIKDRQLLHPKGDWRYHNTWYPDVDDTAAINLAQLKHDPGSVTSKSVLSAAHWIIGMQNPDGGWAAFDVENDRLWLNKIPFSDMDSLCDESCPDITGRILEAFGLMIKIASRTASPNGNPIPALRKSCMRGIDYLAATQRQEGPWVRSVGCNYIYGTSHALCGMAHFVKEEKDGENVLVDRIGELVRPGLQWIKAKQNDDGGWGESLLSYKQAEVCDCQQKQPSTASQTAWALMGLLAHLPVTDEAIQGGIGYLVLSQEKEGTWTEESAMPIPFISQWRKQPETVPTDRIIPLRFWDDMRHLGCFVFDLILRFDHVLDASKLEASLSRLMEINNWGQLGARLRRNSSGRLEYHIPAEYSADRPAFCFTSIRYDMNTRDHALASRIPQSGTLNDDRCGLFPSPSEFAPLLRHPQAPAVYKRFVHFEDGTFVTITHLHTLFDAFSVAAFLKAWTSVLDGREAAVPTFVPFEKDPLFALGNDPSLARNYTLYQSVLNGLGLVIFGLRLVCELLWFRRLNEHVIRLPGNYVRRMQKTAILELETMVKAFNASPNRIIMVMNLMGILSILPYTILPQPTPTSYVSNAILSVYSLLRADRTLAAHDLTYIASNLRRDLKAHRTSDQIQAMAAIQRKSPLYTPFLVGPSNLFFLSSTNLHAVRLFELDFSAAVLSASSSLPWQILPRKPVTPPGRPSLMNYAM